MYKILVWGTGLEYNRHLTILKYFETIGEICIEGVMSNDKEIQNKIDGYRFIKKENIASIKFDYCILTINDIKIIVNEAKSLGVSIDKIIPIRVLDIPYFSFEKYLKIKESRLSILSSNCWAGICYNYLGLEFLSPTINMFFKRDEFNRFIENLDFYLSQKVKFESYGYAKNLNRNYPIGKIEDIYLYFNHYTSFEEANLSWEKRKQRINKENLLIVSSSTRNEDAEEFEKLPYNHKIFFVPKANHIILPSSYSVDYIDQNDGMTIGMYINGVANGKLSWINLLSLLINENDIYRTK